MIRTAALLAILVSGCGGAAGKVDDRGLSPGGSAAEGRRGLIDDSPVPSTATPSPRGAHMDIVYQDLADPAWRHAAELAVANVTSRLQEWSSARVVIRPWRSDDGAAVPYLLHVQATQADGRPGYATPIIVSGDQVGNGLGVAAATGFLASAGFPATRISLGHLLEVLYVSDAINGSWLDPPSRNHEGWTGVGKATSGAAPSLEYTATGAVLHLYRNQGLGDAGEPRTARPGDPPLDPAWRGPHYIPPGPPRPALTPYGAPSSPVPSNAYGSPPPQNPYGSAPPQNPYGSAPPQNPYGSAPPQNPYGSAPPQNPYGSAPPQPSGSYYPGGRPYGMGPTPGDSPAAAPPPSGMPYGGAPAGPVYERLDVTFDRRAGFTLTVLHRDPMTQAWKPVT